MQKTNGFDHHAAILTFWQIQKIACCLLIRIYLKIQTQKFQCIVPEFFFMVPIISFVLCLSLWRIMKIIFQPLLFLRWICGWRKIQQEIFVMALFDNQTENSSATQDLFLKKRSSLITFHSEITRRVDLINLRLSWLQGKVLCSNATKIERSPKHPLWFYWLRSQPTCFCLISLFSWRSLTLCLAPESSMARNYQQTLIKMKLFDNYSHVFPKLKFSIMISKKNVLQF